ncbi:MAG: IMPACT family protein [Comamonas sp.]
MPFSLAHPVHCELVIKKSRFIGCVQPVRDRAHAQQIVDALRAEHPAATHVCWALLAGSDGAANDDGEPSGTAGRPMLNVLRHQDLQNVLATVVRYYGGVKLGAGGLVRAYTDAVAQALLTAEKLPVQSFSELRCRFAYPHEGLVRRLAADAQAEILDVQHAADVQLLLRVNDRELEALRAGIVSATQGQARFETDEAAD